MRSKKRRSETWYSIGYFLKNTTTTEIYTSTSLFPTRRSSDLVLRGLTIETLPVVSTLNLQKGEVVASAVPYYTSVTLPSSIDTGTVIGDIDGTMIEVVQTLTTDTLTFNSVETLSEGAVVGMVTPVTTAFVAAIEAQETQVIQNLTCETLQVISAIDRQYATIVSGLELTSATEIGRAHV